MFGTGSPIERIRTRGAMHITILTPLWAPNFGKSMPERKVPIAHIAI